jgi:hypothetical protein
MAVLNEDRFPLFIPQESVSFITNINKYISIKDMNEMTNEFKPVAILITISGSSTGPIKSKFSTLVISKISSGKGVRGTSFFVIGS